MPTANCIIPAFTIEPGGLGSITYSNVGTLPAGVTFNPSTKTYTFYGLTTPGIYTFTVQGDNLVATSDSATFTVTVTAIPAPTVIPNTGPPYF
jgi:hypothetical protein